MVVHYLYIYVKGLYTAQNGIRGVLDSSGGSRGGCAHIKPLGCEYQRGGRRILDSAGTGREKWDYTMSSCDRLRRWCRGVHMGNHHNNKDRLGLDRENLHR